jgi:hypothetical protein
LLVLIPKNAPDDMRNVRKFASSPLEYRLAPSVVREIGKAIDEGARCYRPIHWKQYVNRERFYELIGQRNVVDRNNGLNRPPQRHELHPAAVVSRATSRPGITQPIRTDR